MSTGVRSDNASIFVVRVCERMTLPLLAIGSCVTDGLVHRRDVDTIQKIGLEEDDTVDDALRLILQTGVLQQAKDFVKSALEEAVDSAEEHKNATSQAVETWTERVQWDVANDLGGVFGCEGAEPEVWCEMTVSAFGDDFKFHSAEFTVSRNDRDTFNLLCDSMENMDTAVKKLAEAVSRFCQLLATRPLPSVDGRRTTANATTTSSAAHRGTCMVFQSLGQHRGAADTANRTRVRTVASDPTKHTVSMHTCTRHRTSTKHTPTPTPSNYAFLPFRLLTCPCALWHVLSTSASST